MPLSSAERTALKWIVAVILIGSGHKLVGQWRRDGATDPAATDALSRQLAAVDSVQRGRAGAGRGGSGRRGRRASRVRDSAAGGDVRASGASSGVSRTDEVPRLAVVDVDAADSAALEGLPRIGPALAARIVADRVLRGPFGSLDGLQRVRGIGPKVAAMLRERVTFSGIPRPFPEQR